MAKLGWGVVVDLKLDNFGIKRVDYIKVKVLPLRRLQSFSFLLYFLIPIGGSDEGLTLQTI